MPRKSQGHVIERVWKRGRGFALRFIAYGERRYITLGLETEGWTRARAEEELQNIMADVRRGIWIPPDRNRRDEQPTPAQTDHNAAPTFHEFASRWLAGRDGEVAPRTVEYETWALTHHLLPYFARHRLDEIDVEAVDDYRRFKVAESRRRRDAIERGRPLRIGDSRSRVLRPLAPRTINKTIDILQMILGVADEYGHVTENAAAGRRRRLTVRAGRPAFIDTVDHIVALLDAARMLDDTPRYRTSDRHAIVSTLLFAGPRAHELCLRQWRDIDLAHRRCEIGRSKTDAGLREIDLLPILLEALIDHRHRSTHTGPDDPVFPTNTGGLRDKDNLRGRVLAPVIALADRLLAERGQRPLPAGLTPHKLRHAFASILVACGEDPTSVMTQLGHTDPKFTLRVYAHMMRRDPAERARLKALVYCEPLDDADSPPDAMAA